MLICSSPQLFAACHVLLRLLMPRHSPYALLRLNFPVSFFPVLVLLNCLSFINKYFGCFFCEKVLSFRFLNSLHLSVKLYFYPKLERPISDPAFPAVSFYLSSYLFVSTLQYTSIRFSMNISRTALPTSRSVLPLVGSSGLEPPTSRLSGARSNHLSYEPIQFPRCISSLIPTRRFRLRQLAAGGDDGNRTHDPLLAGQVLSQLSYTPVSLRGELNNLYGHSKLNNNKLILAFRLTLSLAVSSFWFLLYSILMISSHSPLCRISRSP